MKTNNKLYGIGFVKEDMYQTLANYILKFVDAYELHGFKCWGLSTGNEPTIPFVATNIALNSHCWTFEGMVIIMFKYNQWQTKAKAGHMKH